MSKVNTVVCDICGRTVYRHAFNQYQIRKRLWEVHSSWTRLDLCESCWGNMMFWVEAHHDKRFVLCKDCKWFGKVGCAVTIVDDDDKPTENDFCSFAELKEKEDG